MRKQLLGVLVAAILGGVLYLGLSSSGGEEPAEEARAASAPEPSVAEPADEEPVDEEAIEHPPEELAEPEDHVEEPEQVDVPGEPEMDPPGREPTPDLADLSAEEALPILVDQWTETASAEATDCLEMAEVETLRVDVEFTAVVDNWGMTVEDLHVSGTTREIRDCVVEALSDRLDVHHAEEGDPALAPPDRHTSRAPQSVTLTISQ